MANPVQNRSKCEEITQFLSDFVPKNLLDSALLVSAAAIGFFDGPSCAAALCGYVATRPLSQRAVPMPVVSEPVVVMPKPTTPKASVPVIPKPITPKASVEPRAVIQKAAIAAVSQINALSKPPLLEHGINTCYLAVIVWVLLNEPGLQARLGFVINQLFEDPQRMKALQYMDLAHVENLDEVVNKIPEKIKEIEQSLQSEQTGIETLQTLRDFFELGLVGPETPLFQFSQEIEPHFRKSELLLSLMELSELVDSALAGGPVQANRIEVLRQSLHRLAPVRFRGKDDLEAKDASEALRVLLQPIMESSDSFFTLSLRPKETMSAHLADSQCNVPPPFLFLTLDRAFSQKRIDQKTGQPSLDKENKPIYDTVVQKDEIKAEALLDFHGAPYELRSVIYYVPGHYVAFVKQDTGACYYCNDYSLCEDKKNHESIVQPIKEKTFMQYANTGSVLIYRRQDAGIVEEYKS